MSTNAPGVSDLTLRKLIDGLIASIVRRDGTAPDAAPDAFKDRVGGDITATTAEFAIEFRTNPDGLSAWCKVSPLGDPAGAQAISGNVDLAVLATKLV